MNEQRPEKRRDHGDDLPERPNKKSKPAKDQHVVIAKALLEKRPAQRIMPSEIEFLPCRPSIEKRAMDLYEKSVEKAELDIANFEANAANMIRYKGLWKTCIRVLHFTPTELFSPVTGLRHVPSHKGPIAGSFLVFSEAFSKLLTALIVHPFWQFERNLLVLAIQYIVKCRVQNCDPWPEKELAQPAKCPAFRALRRMFRGVKVQRTSIHEMHKLARRSIEKSPSTFSNFLVQLGDMVTPVADDNQVYYGVPMLPVTIADLKTLVKAIEVFKWPDLSWRCRPEDVSEAYSEHRGRDPTEPPRKGEMKAFVEIGVKDFFRKIALKQMGNVDEKDEHDYGREEEGGEHRYEGEEVQDVQKVQQEKEDQEKAGEEEANEQDGQLLDAGQGDDVHWSGQDFAMPPSNDHDSANSDSLRQDRRAGEVTPFRYGERTGGLFDSDGRRTDASQGNRHPTLISSSIEPQYRQRICGHRHVPPTPIDPRLANGGGQTLVLPMDWMNRYQQTAYDHGMLICSGGHDRNALRRDHDAIDRRVARLEAIIAGSGQQPNQASSASQELEIANKQLEDIRPEADARMKALGAKNADFRSRLQSQSQDPENEKAKLEKKLVDQAKTHEERMYGMERRLADHVKASKAESVQMRQEFETQLANQAKTFEAEKAQLVGKVNALKQERQQRDAELNALADSQSDRNANNTQRGILVEQPQETGIRKGQVAESQPLVQKNLELGHVEKDHTAVKWSVKQRQYSEPASSGR
ncbi:hypothetical protein FHETE_5335 [Fusarium heterosporum]|uniref:Uncharacterized protein n=1 Tax=Fusarium heterosporum TaxID=42747 RepID=A0A8H5TFC2_FUSHE|nr:hypothetical protein FHETE_5335 [Fusarium heterosporum]